MHISVVYIDQWLEYFVPFELCLLHRRISGFALEGANNLGGRSGEFKILVFSLTCSNLYFNHSYCNLIQRTFINIFLGGGGFL